MYHEKGPIELEADIREICAIDPSNPELYSKIKELAIIIMENRDMVPLDAREEIAHDLAANLYLRVNNGTVVYYWRKYIRLECLRFRGEYRAINNTQFFEAPDVINKREMVKRLFAGSLEISSLLSVKGIDEVFDELPYLVNKIIDKSVRYTSFRDCGNIKLAILIHLNKYKECRYRYHGKAKSSDINYISAISKIVFVNSLKYICDELNDTQYFDELSLNCGLSAIGYETVDNEGD